MTHRPASFHRATRVIALVCVVALVACTDWVIGPEPSTSSTAIFDALWSDFDAHYSFFELKGIDWDSIRTVYRPLAAHASNDAELFETLAGMLAELHDVHVTLNGPDESYHWDPPYRIDFDSTIAFTRYVIDAHHSPSGHLHYGRCMLDSTVGYIAIPMFTDAGWTHEIDDVLDSLAGVRAIVIDVRGNGGGDTQNAVNIASRFADSARTFAYVRYRNGPRHSDFTPDIPETVAPAGARRFTGPVVVLTNRQVFSAAEEFVLAMHALPTVTTLGDTTGGGSGNPLVRELPNGWTYQISQWIEYTPQGRTFEGVGLAPDTAIPVFPQDRSRGIDRQLRSAVRRLSPG
ncbi:MAG TPA: S41 family peptidase [Gemmatimonadaceae bacterium]|nr:S41 family peptidase [Gemmatimonadaceae bacterium]